MCGQALQVLRGKYPVSTDHTALDHSASSLGCNCHAVPHKHDVPSNVAVSGTTSLGAEDSEDAQRNEKTHNGRGEGRLGDWNNSITVSNIKHPEAGCPHRDAGVAATSSTRMEFQVLSELRVGCVWLSFRDRELLAQGKAPGWLLLALFSLTESASRELPPPICN